MNDEGLTDPYEGWGNLNINLGTGSTSSISMSMPPPPPDPYYNKDGSKKAYIIVTSEIEFLVTQVNNKIEEGYECLGGVTVNNTSCFQGMRLTTLLDYVKEVN